LDIASLAGIILCGVMVVYGILSSGSTIAAYIDVPSIIITFGGSFACVLTCFKLDEFLNGFKGLLLICELFKKVTLTKFY